MTEHGVTKVSLGEAMEGIEVAIDPAVRARWRGEAVLTVTILRGCRPFVGADLASEAAALVAQLKSAGPGLLQEPRVQAMRAAFRAMPDMDPARYRPASEALIRRFQSSGFISISPLVDLNNILSARLRIPLGIYDLTRLGSTSWIYRLGGPGESYETISGAEKSASGKLVLADEAGVFGSPVADSGRAPIGSGSTDVAIVGFLPLDMSSESAKSSAADVHQAIDIASHCASKRYAVLRIADERLNGWEE